MRSRLLIPQGVVTVTITGPGKCGGVMAMIVLSSIIVKLIAGKPPKSTAMAPVKPIPLMVTVVNPEVGPEGGVGSVMMKGGSVQAGGEGGLPPSTEGDRGGGAIA